MDNNGLTENDHEILKAFGGATTNNLNSIIHSNEDHSDGSQTLSHSAYYDLETIVTYDQLKTHSFKVLSLNIQSIHAKFDSFTGFLQILLEKGIIFDAILIQETWLSDVFLSKRENVALFQLPGYNLTTQGKTCCGHGGLFTYVLDTYKISPRPSLYKRSEVYEALYIDVFNENFRKKSYTW